MTSKATVRQGAGRTVARIQELAKALLPQEAVVAVVSKGDPDLVDLNDAKGWHFPQTEEGIYAGHHLASSEEAISRFEDLHTAGAEYLLFPATSLWWLDYYGDFRKHLDRWYRRLVDEPDTCVIFSLREPPVTTSAPDDRTSPRYLELARQLRELLAATLPPGAHVLVLDDATSDLVPLDGLEARLLHPDRGDPSLARALKAAGERSDRSTFLVVPSFSNWRLEYPTALKRVLESYPLAVHQQHLGRIYTLSSEASGFSP
jgi:hypothetical protein